MAETFTVEWDSYYYGHQTRTIDNYDEAVICARQRMREGHWVRTSFEFSDEEAATEGAAKRISLKERLDSVTQTIRGLEYSTRNEGFDPKRHDYDRGTLWYLREFEIEREQLEESIYLHGEQSTWKLRTYGAG